MQITKKIILNTNNDKPNSRIVIKQGCIGTITLIVTINDKGGVLTLPAGTTAKVRMLKSDKKQVLNDCEVVGNNVHVEITQQMQASVGDGNCEVVLFRDTKTFTTVTFPITIEPNVHDDSEIESTPEYNTLLNSLIRIEDAVPKAEQAYIVAQEAITVLTEAEGELEQFRADKDIALSQVAQATQAANTAASNANTKASTADLATQNANQAAQSVAEAKQGAENATANANTAIENVEDKITEVESRFQALTTEQQQAAEVIDARKGKASLTAKIDDIDSHLAETANQKADKSQTNNIQKQLDNLVLGAVGDGNNPEIIQSRGSYPLVNARLDSEFSLLKNQTLEFIRLNALSAKRKQYYINGVLTQDGSDGWKLVKYDVTNIDRIYVTAKNYVGKDLITLFDATGEYLSSYNNSTGSAVSYIDNEFDVSSASHVMVSQYYNSDNFDVKILQQKSNDISNDFTEISADSFVNGNIVYDTYTVTDTDKVYVYNIEDDDIIKITGTIRQYQNKYAFVDENLNVLDFDIQLDSSNLVDILINCKNYKKLAISSVANGGCTWKVFGKINEKILAKRIVGESKNKTSYIPLKWIRTELFSYQKNVKYAPLNLCSNVYDVSELDKIKIISNGVPYVNHYTLFKNGSIISYEFNNSANVVKLENTIDVTNADEIYVTVNRGNEKHNGACYIDTEIQPDTWREKTIGYYGTSIQASGTEGYNHPESYPRLLGGLLGANLVNHAVGESSIHCKDYTLISTSNPYGFVSDFKNCARCLTNTTTEMQWIIDNFNSGVFTTNVPSSLSDDDKALILSCSYENRLLPYLDSTDLFVFDHGHNDLADSGTHAYDSLVATHGTKNLYSYVGAMNFLVDIIKTNNPRARIVQISEYDYNTNKAGVDKQRKFAEIWGIPFFELYKQTGWSSPITIVTTGYWGDDGYWVASGGVSQNLTIRQMHMKDDLHPHTDRSNKTNWFLANILLKWFLYNLS